MRYVLPYLGRGKSSGLSYVASSAGSGTSSRTLTFPGGIQAGDTVLICASATAAISTPSGYTLWASTSSFFPGGGVTYGYVFSKVMGGTPDTSIAITAAFVSIVAHVWRGVDTATPMDVTPTTSGTYDCPSITPVTAGAHVIAFTGGGFNASVALSKPTGYDNDIQTNIYGTPDFVTNFYYTAAVASKAWGSGAENPAGFYPTSGTGADASFGITLALRPA